MSFLKSRLRRCCLVDVPLSTERSLTDECAKLLENGATSLLFRFSRSPQDPKQLKDLHSAFELCREKGVYAFVQDDVMLTLSLGAHGIYFSKLPKNLPWARQVLGSERFIGIQDGGLIPGTYEELIDFVDFRESRVRSVPCQIVSTPKLFRGALRLIPNRTP